MPFVTVFFTFPPLKRIPSTPMKRSILGFTELVPTDRSMTVFRFVSPSNGSPFQSHKGVQEMVALTKTDGTITVFAMTKGIITNVKLYVTKKSRETPPWIPYLN